LNNRNDERAKNRRKKNKSDKESTVADGSDGEETDRRCTEQEAGDVESTLAEQMDELKVEETPAADHTSTTQPTQASDEVKKKTIWEDTSSEDDNVADNAKDGDKIKLPNNTTKHVCEKCQEHFSSKNKLMAHLKDSGHASLKPAFKPSAATDFVQQQMNSDKKMSKKKKREMLQK